MAALRGNRYPEQYTSASRIDSYRPGDKTGDKLRLYSECDSLASKVSRVTYNCRAPNPTSAPQYRTNHNASSIQRQGFFKPGTIIRADHFEEAYDGGSTITNDRSIIRVPGEKPICKKVRFFIILAGHSLAYVCIPIFSHNGNGLRYKRNPEEFVSIRDHRAIIKAPQQSIHEPLVTKDMSGMELLPASVVHLAYPVSQSYGIPVTMVGHLTTNSTNQCIRLFRNYMPVEICETLKPSSTDLSINAEMSVSKALTILRLNECARFFYNTSWDDATALRDSDLERKGVTSKRDRQQITSLFDKAWAARKSGRDWRVKISNDDLRKV
jgi:hypothetical protein